jgi:hypothetical protein
MFQAVAQISVKTLAPADLGLLGGRSPRYGGRGGQVRPDCTAGARHAPRRRSSQVRPQPAVLPAVPPSPAALELLARAKGCLAAAAATGILCCAYGSGRSSRRSRNTMRVKPYAIRSPSRNARQTALRAPGGSISTSGCSCRYRSSLRTWFGRPGGTSCTGQYRCPVSGPRNRLLKTVLPAAAIDTLRRHGCAGAHHKPGITTTCGAAARQYPRSGLRAADTTRLLIR